MLTKALESLGVRALQLVPAQTYAQLEPLLAPRLEAMRPWLRLWLPSDITLLGWPGSRFWLAHRRHVLCYGESVYLRDCRYAEARHLEWVTKGYTLTLRRNWRRRLYVSAKEPLQPKPTKRETA